MKDKMEELIELLNEYTNVDFVKFEDGTFKERYMGEEGRWDNQFEIITKEYGFVKWLVENDKVDFDKVNEKEKSEQVDICIYGKNGKEENTDWLLMLLSIQDNPIQFLCEILK